LALKRDWPRRDSWSPRPRRAPSRFATRPLPRSRATILCWYVQSPNRDRDGAPRFSFPSSPVRKTQLTCGRRSRQRDHFRATPSIQLSFLSRYRNMRTFRLGRRPVPAMHALQRLPQRAVDKAAHLIDFGFAGDQRRRYGEPGRVDAHDQAILDRGSLQGIAQFRVGLHRLRILDELDASQNPFAANFPDDTVFLELFQLAGKVLARLPGLWGQLVLNDLLQDGDSYRTGHRVAGKGVAVGELHVVLGVPPEGVGHIFAGNHGPNRHHAAGQALPTTKQIGGDPKSLGREHRPGLTHPRDNLIVNQHDLIAGANFPENLEILVRGGDDAPGVADRLDDHTRHRLRVFVDDDVFHHACTETIA